MNIRLAALIPFTFACGPKDAPVESAADSDAAPAALTGADLAGRWASGGCEAYDDGQGGKSYLTRDFTLTADTWTLDLSALKQAWQTAYQSQTGTIMLHVAGETIHLGSTR